MEKKMTAGKPNACVIPQNPVQGRQEESRNLQTPRNMNKEQMLVPTSPKSKVSNNYRNKKKIIIILMFL
jgi:hypothetical protein